MGNPLEEEVGEVEGEEQFRHNWMYGFSPSYTDIINKEVVVYLAGYCKNCQTGLTVRLRNKNEAGEVVLTNMDIPRWGCVDISASLGV